MGRSPMAAAMATLTRPSPQPAKLVEAVYEVPYLAHAPMEPLNATAHWRADRIDVWMGTQSPELALALAAKAGGVDPKAVFVHNCFLGGGFGRRAVNDELTQAVEVSKALEPPDQADLDARRGHPLGSLPPAGGAPDARRAARGRLAGRASTSPPRSARSPARSAGARSRTGSNARRSRASPTVPIAPTRFKVGVNLKNTHVPVMFWRSVGSSQNAFAVESFIDEFAHAAKRDPLEYRRALLEGRPDFLAVLDTLADKGDWGKPLPKGVGRGMAIHEAFGTIVGEIAEVAVSDSGEVKVQRVVACVDCGHLVNPLTAAMQIESAVLYGLTAALFGEITIKQGRVEQGNFDSYPIARMADAPVIETHFALSGGDKWGGLGEPGTPPIAPAIANAVFAVTGKRIRSLPLKNASLGV